jgi:hypothetical protein
MEMSLSVMAAPPVRLAGGGSCSRSLAIPTFGIYAPPPGAAKRLQTLERHP